MKEVLSRRGIVGFLGLLAAAPKAVEAQAIEVLRDQIRDSEAYDLPPQGACGGHRELTLEQIAPLALRWAKAMGWMPPNADESDMLG